MQRTKNIKSQNGHQTEEKNAGRVVENKERRGEIREAEKG